MLRHGGHGQRGECDPITHTHTHGLTHALSHAHPHTNTNPYSRGVLSQFHDSGRVRRA